MIRRTAVLAAFAVLAVGLAGAVSAGHDEEGVTVQGDVMCAMCVLKEEGLKDCQNVLRVDDGGETVDYYLVKNEVADKFGQACAGPRGAQVTGTVEEKDGKMWLTASKMVPLVKKA